MKIIQIPPDFRMPGYRAHLAGAAALLVEFGDVIDQQSRAWDLAWGRRPTDVCQGNRNIGIGVAR